ncbi:hypothetical protein COCNU_scaffold002433G000010 [Cocos nucifera]|nr:hypothetical protein [Cocos nucifera]
MTAVKMCAHTSDVCMCVRRRWRFWGICEGRGRTAPHEVWQGELDFYLRFPLTLEPSITYLDLLATEIRSTWVC